MPGLQPHLTFTSFPRRFPGLAVACVLPFMPLDSVPSVCLRQHGVLFCVFYRLHHSYCFISRVSLLCVLYFPIFVAEVIYWIAACNIKLDIVLLPLPSSGSQVFKLRLDPTTGFPGSLACSFQIVGLLGSVIVWTNSRNKSPHSYLYILVIMFLRRSLINKYVVASIIWMSKIPQRAMCWLLSPRLGVVGQWWKLDLVGGH